VGAAAPRDWQRGSTSIVEAFPSVDGATKAANRIMGRVKAELNGAGATLGGPAAENRDFVRAVYSNFPYVLGLVVLLTFVLLARMREAYDETGRTQDAVALGLARTGKLVTSAALVLMFAFFVLSSSPGVDIKQFGIGLAAGIIFDATVIRALLVPALMRLLGRWNWWLPTWAARPLRTRPSDPFAEARPATESA